MQVESLLKLLDNSVSADLRSPSSEVHIHYPASSSDIKPSQLTQLTGSFPVLSVVCVVLRTVWSGLSPVQRL